MLPIRLRSGSFPKFSEGPDVREAEEKFGKVSRALAHDLVPCDLLRDKGAEAGKGGVP